MCLQFGFVIFCQKKIGTKITLNMLMKLTAGINFIPILLIAFWIKVQFRAFLFLQPMFFFGETKL